MMFTGLIESMGRVVSSRTVRQGRELTIDAGFDLSSDRVGDSFAVDGVCLTATAIEGTRFTAAASAETVSRSTLGTLKTGSAVNIERAMLLSSRLGGHIVLGHVDCVGTIRAMEDAGESVRVGVSYDTKYARYIIEKGSVTVDGISLTVNRIERDLFEVNIIPHTSVSVTLTRKKPGDRVNLEFDLIGKYVERLMKQDDNTDLEALLKKQGYI